jgi:catechol 2,3-dioxygenase-like lactoylglutathione lyase family enzyme
VAAIIHARVAAQPRPPPKLSWSWLSLESTLANELRARQEYDDCAELTESGPSVRVPHRRKLLEAPVAHEGFFVTHFFTVRDQEKSKDFYVRILGGKGTKAENPCYIKLANSWIVLNSGGGPTPDKPEVLLETRPDLNRMNSFLNLRVADIWDCYRLWNAKGAVFLTEPLENHTWEWRCYMRDPDGYLIEVGQYTQVAIDRFNEYSRNGGPAPTVGGAR